MKLRRLIFAIIILVIAAGSLYLNPLLPIITGYAAKNLSSGVFVANRTQESMEATDLNFSFIKYVKNKIDYENKMVKSRFLWHTSTAIYIEGYGCVLVNDSSIDEIKNRPYAKIAMECRNTDTIPWPMGDLVADTLPQGIDAHALTQALDMGFIDTLPYKGTFAVAVVYKGQLIAERYKNGLTKETKFLSWSMAKSFTNSLVGIMVKQGKIDINTPLNIDAWQADNRKNITWNNLMHMNSGLAWNENYGSNSDVNVMLHKIGDMGNYAQNKPFETRMDSLWIYSSGTTNIVSLAMRRTLANDSVYYAFPRIELFNKVGMHTAIFEVDASGTFVGSSYLYASMRDYARYGLLYLNNGNWLGEQILPKDWVSYTTTEANGSDGQYGAFFWLNLAGKDYPDVPRDMYYARGHDGQYIYIIPSKDLVVVRTGFSKKGQFDNNAFLAGIVNAVTQ